MLRKRLTVWDPRFAVGDRVRVTEKYLKWALEGSHPPRPSRLSGVIGTITEASMGSYEVDFNGILAPGRGKSISPTWLMREDWIEKA